MQSIAQRQWACSHAQKDPVIPSEAKNLFLRFFTRLP